MRLRLGTLRRIIREVIDLDEVDTDPSNNPGRPADAYDYLGMHPKATAAMAPPGSSGGESGGDGDPSQPPDAPSGEPNEGE